MRLAIDASRTTVTRVTGTEHYAIQMIRELLRINDRHQLTLYFRDTPSRDLFPLDQIRRPDLVTRQVIPFPRAWTHARLSTALLKDRPDLLWVPAHTLPFAFPGQAVVTLHDLGYKVFPNAHPEQQRKYLDLTTRYSAKRAALILADSQATADDLTSFYQTSPTKIRVVYPGINPPRINSIAEVRAKYNLPERYFLFIGTLQPRKNIARIVQAFDQWKNTHRNERTALVLAGGKGWLFDPAWIEGVSDVIVPGYIQDDEKGALYAGAVGLVFPSLYEGFGFPVLEAMLCGCPVIAAHTSSLPELVGDAALLVDPLDVGAIADAMAQLSENPALCADLTAKGRQQAKQFTWQAAAARAMSIFESMTGV
ncbi:MAG: glycosyltransferase family 1 protein [Anaerolineae bacterium]